MIPKRIQRRRTKGWRMPPNTAYVGRPTIYGNPFRANECYIIHHPDDPVASTVMLTKQLYGEAGVRARLVALYGMCVNAGFPVPPWALDVWRQAGGSTAVLVGLAGGVESFIAPLRGENLACWCPLDHPCHADVLLKLANEKGGEG